MNDEQLDRSWVVLVIAIVLFVLSVVILFLTYSKWWNRVFYSSSFEAIGWLDVFQKWPWLRLPAMWSIMSVFVGCIARTDTNVGSYSVLFIVILMLSYPGIEALGVGSDPNGFVCGLLLTILHSAAVSIILHLRDRGIVCLSNKCEGDR